MLWMLLITGSASWAVGDSGPWEIAPPDAHGANWDNGLLANACQPPENAGKKNLTKAFACPRLMLGSGEMLAGAAYDAKKNSSWSAGGKPIFAYGVVGRDAAPGAGDEPCTCYQLEPATAGAFQPLIVQWANTGANGCQDPKTGQCDFDLFMGLGGTGNFNACIGGRSNSSTFGDFMYSAYPWAGQPWGGGASETSECAVTGLSSYATTTTNESCKFGLDGHYKGNPEIVWQQVQCPIGLIRVTGCELADNSTQPVASPNPQTGSWLKGYITSMQDCCLPSAGWVNNVSNAQSPWLAIYSCDAQGIPWTVNNPVQPPPPKVKNCCSWDGCQTCGTSTWCNENKSQCTGSCNGAWCA